MGTLQGKAAQTRQLSIRASEFSEGHLIQPKLKEAGIDVDTGQPFYYEHINANRFKVASPSFFQVNNDQVSNIIEAILGSDMIDEDSRVLDAYAGVGTLAILIAPYVKYVLGIEDSAAATVKINIENIWPMLSSRYEDETRRLKLIESSNNSTEIRINIIFFLFKNIPDKPRKNKKSGKVKKIIKSI